jgi:hypothetical protein
MKPPRRHLKLIEEAISIEEIKKKEAEEWQNNEPKHANELLKGGQI